jgi:hypothetical protein
VVRFLKHLVRHLGRGLVIWDGLPAHRARVVKELPARGGSGPRAAGAPAGLHAGPEPEAGHLTAPEAD